MSSNTETLNLLKMDPVTDGNSTFNIKTMLNDNWDKLDAHAKDTKKALADASTALMTEKTAREQAVSTEVAARQQAVTQETTARQQNDTQLNQLILTKLAEAKEYAITKACQALVADGGLDGTELVQCSASGYIGRAKDGTHGTANVTISFKSLPQEASIGFLGDVLWSLEYAGDISLAASPDAVGITVTVFLNNSELSQLKTTTSFRPFLNSISVDSVLISLGNISAAVKRPLTQNDVVKIVLETKPVTDGSYAPVNVAASLSAVRYLEA